MSASPGTVFVPVKPDASTFQRDLGSKVRTSLSAIGGKMKSAGRSLTRSVTLPIVGAGVAAVKLASDFDGSMSKIQGLVGISGQKVKEMGDQVLALSKTLPQSPKELADALFFVTSAGFRGKEAMDVLEASAKAAAAGLGETQVVADAVTSAVNAYGPSVLSAATATDTLVATVREGKAEASAIAPVLGNILPLTSELGVGFDEVGAAIASMTKTGTNAATSATNIQAILTGFLKPTGEAAAGLKEVGLSAEGIRESIANKGLFQTLMDLRGSFDGNTGAIAKVIPNVRALRGFLSLTGKSAKDNAGIFDRMTDSTGAMDKAFDAASKTADFQLKSAFSTIQATGVELGRVLAPMAVTVAKALSGLVEKFSSLSPTGKKVVVIIGAILAVIGPLLVIVGSLVTAIAAIGLPALAVVAGLAALVAILVKAYTTSETFRNIVNGAFQSILAFAKKMWPQVKRVIQSAVEAVKAVIERVTIIIQHIWKHYGDLILRHTKIVWNTVKGVIRGGLEIIRNIFKAITAIMRGDWSALWDAVKGILKGAWTIVKSVVKGGFDALKNLFEAVKRTLSGIWNGLWTGIKSAASNIWSGIISAAKGGVNSLISIINNAIGRINSALSVHINPPGPGRIDFDLNLPKIPLLAKGGIVTQPTLAVVGEAGPEAVVPLSKLGAMGGGSPRVVEFRITDWETGMGQMRLAWTDDDDENDRWRNDLGGMK